MTNPKYYILTTFELTCSRQGNIIFFFDAWIAYALCKLFFLILDQKKTEKKFRLEMQYSCTMSHKNKFLKLYLGLQLPLIKALCWWFEISGATFSDYEKIISESGGDVLKLAKCGFSCSVILKARREIFKCHLSVWTITQWNDCRTTTTHLWKHWWTWAPTCTQVICFVLLWSWSTILFFSIY